MAAIVHRPMTTDRTWQAVLMERTEVKRAMDNRIDSLERAKTRIAKIWLA